MKYIYIYTYYSGESSTSPSFFAPGPLGGAFGRGAQAQWPHQRGAHGAGAGTVPQAKGQGAAGLPGENAGVEWEI